MHLPSFLFDFISDAPDGRKLQLTVYEGEQHDLRQLVADFFEHHSMAAEFVDGMTAEVAKRYAPATHAQLSLTYSSRCVDRTRLPKIALEIPIQLPGRRGVVMKFAARDNVTSVVNAFEVHYEVGFLRLRPSLRSPNICIIMSCRRPR